MASIKGLERGPNDRKGKYDFAVQNRGQWQTDVVTVTASNASPVPAIAKFNDFWTGSACLCSGAVQVVGTAFIGVLKEDCLNGSVASIVTTADDIYLPAYSADTFAAGTKVYWDATNYRITTTSTSNILCGIALAAKETVATDVLNELATGTWVRINLLKNL